MDTVDVRTQIPLQDLVQTMYGELLAGSNVR